MKEARTIEEQIILLQDRGMKLDQGEEKAKEILSDIGYYRLGFYCFPFEKSYPNKTNRTHELIEDSQLSDVIALYYLDADLRHLLLKYINRIEINLRTNIINSVSTKYKHTATWFVDNKVMDKKYIEEFDKKIYTDTFRKTKVIKGHHIKYINDKYAPAWKTLEYLTFGQIYFTYKNLKDSKLKQYIALKYGITAIDTMENYVNTIVKIRNTCAHGDILFDFNLPMSIKKGPALTITSRNRSSLNSCILVINYILRQISTNRADDMQGEIKQLFKREFENCKIKKIIEDSVGYIFD